MTDQYIFGLVFFFLDKSYIPGNLIREDFCFSMLPFVYLTFNLFSGGNYVFEYT